MKLPPFRIEQYYAKYEFSARYMLSSSDAESHSVQDLLALEPDAHERLLEQWLGYTESPGAPYLRAAIASLYQSLDADHILVCASAEEGIFLLYQALLGPGDHVIVETPCYESGLELARGTGAQVDEWRRHYEDGWAHDVDALARLLRPTTKAIYINTPHNPTGLLMDADVYQRIVAMARERGIILFCDEVYRELEHDPAARLPAACDLYENAVSLGSMSKAYGLAGLRLGWLATRNIQTLQRALDLRYYTTICNSAPSEFLSALALRHRATVVGRNLAIIQRNLPVLEEFFARRDDLFAWVAPDASAIGFPRFKPERDVVAFCEQVVQEVGVLLLPGTVYDEPRHLRVGFGRENMPEALGALDAYLASAFRHP